MTARPRRSVRPGTPVDLELVAERAAVREYLGGYPREEAERLGRRDAEEWRPLVVAEE